MPAILAIYNASIPLRIATADVVAQSMEAREAWWNDRDLARHPVLVIEREGAVVGWGAFSKFKDRAAYAPTAEISIYVAPDQARMGLGRAMLDALLERAPQCGIDRILAICFAHNEPSVKLFQSRGFEEWGMMPEVCDFDGLRRSVVILGKRIAAST